MRKIIMAALAALAMALGMAAAPASGSQSALAGSVFLYDQPNFQGTEEEVLEIDIPTSCSEVPDNLTTVRSAKNLTHSSGTAVAFYAQADTTCSSALVILEPGELGQPGEDDPDINPTTGAGRWEAVSS